MRSSEFWRIRRIFGEYFYRLKLESVKTPFVSRVVVRKPPFISQPRHHDNSDVECGHNESLEKFSFLMCSSDGAPGPKGQ